MAKKRSKQALPPDFASSPAKTKWWFGATAITAVVLVCFLAASYLALPDELPWPIQHLLGLVCATLAVVVYSNATRPSRPEEVFERLKRGQHLDFGKKLRTVRREPRKINIPLLGETQVRSLGGIAIFVVAGAWWLTPWAPVAVKEPEKEDLAVPLGNEIVAVVLVMTDGDLATAGVPILPLEARTLAQSIGQYDEPYQRGLKAIAEGRFSDARTFLGEARKTAGGDIVKIYVAQAQAELYATQFRTAVQLYDDALERSPDDPMIFCQAAVAGIHAGALQKAQGLADKALALCRENLPQDDPLLATSLHVLAAVYASLGKEFDQAEQLNLQAREIWKQNLGDEHPNFAASLNNQAVLNQVRARYSGALNLGNWAHDIWVKRLGERHPHVADSLGNLAMLRYRQGKYPEAQEGIAEALAIREALVQKQHLPENHPVLPLGMTNTAVIASTLADYKKAQRLTSDALLVFEKQLGPRHPNVAACANIMAACYTARARYNKAGPYYLRAGTVTRDALGSDHPYLAVCRNNLANLCLVQGGRQNEAKKHAEDALQLAEETFGPKHPCVADALCLQGRLAVGEELFRDARPLFGRALEIQEEMLGEEHPDVAATLGYLAALDNSPRTYNRGINRFKRGIAMDERILGRQHPEVARLKFGMAMLQFQRHRYAEADKLLKQSMAIRLKVLVPFHPDLAVTMEAYARLLREINPPNPKKAAKLQKDAKAIRARHAKEDQPE